MSGRLRVVGALVLPTIRLLPWWHLLGGALLAAIPIAVAHQNQWIDLPGLVQTLRLSAVALGASAAFVFDDPTEAMLAGTPVTVRIRRLLRLALLLPVMAGLWAGLLWYATGTPAIQPEPGATTALGVPVGALWLEAGGLALTTVAAASVSLHLSQSAMGGLAAAPTVLGLAGLTAAMPPPASWWLWAPYPSVPPATTPPTSAPWLTWVASHQRWTAVTGLALLMVLLAARDRGTRFPTSRSGVWGAHHLERARIDKEPA